MHAVTDAENVDRDALAEAGAPIGGDAVRWLTPTERRAWLSIVATHMQLMPTLEADLHRDGPVSFFEYQVLAMLSENDGPLAMSELAARTNSSLSRLSHVARKLEARGWIERMPSSEDARVTMAAMTELGMRELVRIAPHHVASVRRWLLDVLDDRDLEDIGRIGAKILGHLDPGHWIFRDPVLTAEDPSSV
ncbi:MarR family transcriptional regulator [Citricoccus sp. SGAir0253]|uniref:MarR family winged helix-turn-helix transcriptional regulator n=1 Tax=Citricoccus sp. SGAir0253 TaxID=2567881 RepID=UPI0010CD4FC1|nr:MarR family transcriptional regulator [Citricoccus sp. SGAir0253]QCU77243.1 MarR family transcriptional regulator [Citricoccus sp. SGAir0253]